MKTLEVQLAEAQQTIEAQKAAIKTLTESNTALQKAAAQATLAKRLSESKLPKASQDAITKQFSEATDDKQFAEAIEFHATLVKELGGPTKKNLGGISEAQVTEAQKAETKAKLVEGYQKLGMSKAEAEKAAENK